MSNTVRPTAARKQTARTSAKADEALEQGIRITIDGVSHEVRLEDVTSTVTRELRAVSGMSFNRLMSEVTTDPDTDVLAAFIWLSRRIGGEVLDLDDVVVTYRQLLADDFSVSLPDGRSEGVDNGDGDDDPEA